MLLSTIRNNVLNPTAKIPTNPKNNKKTIDTNTKMKFFID